MDYLEDYVDIMEGLPAEIQKQFTLLRELESVSKKADDTILEIVHTVLKKRERLELEDRRKLVTQLGETFDESTRIAKEKLAIATQAYETVDRHIRRLDNDYHRFDAALTLYNSSAKSSERDAEFRHAAARRHAASASAIKQNAVPKKRSVATSIANPNGSRKRPPGPKDEEEIDILDHEPYDPVPIDPNEPTYCFCGQVSFGEMIACDNDDCDIKWFHSECIGLKTIPKGKWYCSECSVKRKKGSK